MKTRNVMIIIGMVIVASIGTYVFLPHLKFPINYANLELVGINDTYNAGQIIKFQVKASGYGYTCGTPGITIYKSDRPSVVVFEKRAQVYMCPLEGPTWFSAVYPSKNDTYSLTINDPSKYTADVSFLNSEIKKEFEVK